ncbi:MAG: hypothetical protein CBC33_000550 [Coraliomargarita sp. TMED73]|nr:MAG: hypothetical protein CBC33_000550 [Coraliomargarita sp. TMED73]|tara:strand:- start:3049 stop:4515 length:1467 start_codon:yes stop_codon:yes gene_type:complete
MSAPLRVAILHYHLKRGGVTRVIESTLRGFSHLKEVPIQAVVLTGELPEDFLYQEQACVVEGLHYSNSQTHTPDPATLLQRLRNSAREALGAEPDIWHFHNHSLGKNTAVPGVVSLLAEAGEALLLQIHDFAEDGRPQNYRCNQTDREFADKLYPLGNHIHYGLINGRDYAIFADNNLPASKRHLLANPVEVGDVQDDPESVSALRSALHAENFFLCPVRALRRKNPGELLLWSALARPRDVFATTLGPTNPEYQQTYRAWKSLANRYQLPAHFGIGDTMNFPFSSMMQAADCILSTSIAEGFGLSFLEPGLFGRPVAGRDLPEITADFKEKDIQLESLYRSLPIPASWIDKDSLSAEVDKHLGETYAAYGRQAPKDATERALKSIQAKDNTYDFGGLNEALQSKVIERLVEHPMARQELPLETLPIPRFTDQAPRIRQTYGLDAFTRNLAHLYQQISDERVSPVDYLTPGNLLDSFLMPERFRLLRT